MKRIRFLKIFLLVFTMVLFATGCGNWSDVQEQYGDLLNKGVSCTYKNNGEDTLGITSLVLSADYNGAYVSLNGVGKQTLINADGTNNWISFNGHNINFTDNAIMTYLQEYQNLGRCPSDVYILSDSQSGVEDFRTSDCVDMGGFCNAYKWKSGSSTDSSSCTTKAGCNMTCATSCQQYTKNVDNYGGAGVEDGDGNEVVTIEVGEYLANGVTKKYLGIIADRAYTSTEDEGLIVTRDLDRYEIYSGSINKIWLGNGKYASAENLTIKVSATTPYSTYYISDKSATDAPGDVDVSGNLHTTELSMPEIKTCSDLLGSPSTPGDPAYYLVVAFNVIKYVAIILLIVLSVIDFIGAVASSDQEALTKATKKVIKRFVLCVIIFMLPVLLKYILTYVHNKNIDLCGI